MGVSVSWPRELPKPKAGKSPVSGNECGALIATVMASLIACCCSCWHALWTIVKSVLLPEKIFALWGTRCRKKPPTLTQSLTLQRAPEWVWGCYELFRDFESSRWLPSRAYLNTLRMYKQVDLILISAINDPIATLHTLFELKWLP